MVTTDTPIVSLLRDVAAMLPVAARLHSSDLTSLQTRVCTALSSAESADTEVWYVIEYEDNGEWYETGESAETEASGLEKLRDRREASHGLNYRLVRKTLTSEVIG
jgi:hypothetical protein